jgi:hypothetical protein
MLFLATVLLEAAAVGVLVCASLVAVWRVVDLVERRFRNRARRRAQVGDGKASPS